MSYVANALGPDGFGAYRVEWADGQPLFERVSEPPELLLVPGFVDIHIHGGYGVDVMYASTDELSFLCGKLREAGYEGFLPTLQAAPAKDMLNVINKLPDDPMILGFHIEGPFINPERSGALPPEAIVTPPDGPSEWDEVLDHPMLSVVTVAPEVPHALDLILRLKKRGVIASMGHTSATYEEMRRGFEFGASHTTHTYNAMRALHHREVGALGYAFINDDLCTEVIYDRHHVCPEAAALLLKCKPQESVIAVSDGTMATGMPEGVKMTLFGVECITGKGDVRIAATGGLAGSAITLKDAFQNLAEDFGPEIAIRACSLNPRKGLRMADNPTVWLEFDKRYELIGRR